MRTTPNLPLRPIPLAGEVWELRRRPSLAERLTVMGFQALGIIAFCAFVIWAVSVI